MTQQRVEPVRDRPKMPDGYGVPEQDDTLLTWEWAEERLERALNLWFSTTRPDGRPHAMPAWGAWLDGRLYFEGSPETRRARNVTANPAVVVHLESGDEVVIVEGEAQGASPPPRDVAERLSVIFDAKYGASHDYHPKPDQWEQGGLWAAQPKTVFAWSKFPDTVTRFRFG
ncbi:MAG: pyridoxamine 5'-phosphate oxidase [Dehalococcoidia bacterium]|nr:pyridoxamine 5'-phosphate oxidase [Dehalococcoidia bacterium]